LRPERDRKCGRPHDGSICASVPRDPEHVREVVETRARIPPPNGGKTKVNEESGWTPSPCLGLDVHKSTTTATYLGRDGKTKRVWTFPTTRGALAALSREVEPQTPIVLEASTAGKAVATILKEAGRELHMASPKDVGLIAKSSVKTDERDSAKLAHLFQAGFLPECYVPPPEIDRMRALVRQRQDVGRKVTLVKNQVHALVTSALLDSEMGTVSDWFGVTGLRRLVQLPFGPEQRAALARYLRQLNYLASQEDELQRELAQVAVDREDVRLLMSIPGVDYYTAVALVGEIGDVRRFPTKKTLASYAGLVPRADNSGSHISSHSRVKPGDMVLKRFLCGAVMGMLLARQDTAVKQFYQKKAKQIGGAKAQVAAARKLSAVVWWILTNRAPYREQDQDLTERKEAKLDRVAAHPTEQLSPEALTALGEELGAKASILDRLNREWRLPSLEEKEEGNG
jgi:transposase